jgi:hypothetical protein
MLVQPPHFVLILNKANQLAGATGQKKYSLFFLRTLLSRHMAKNVCCFIYTHRLLLVKIISKVP